MANRRVTGREGFPAEEEHMAQGQRYLTFDLGAESGRAVAGLIANGRLDLSVVHRFPNEPQWILRSLRWDTVRLFAEMKAGLTKCVKEHGPQIAGIGVDTWGVDYGLLDDKDELLGLPYHYRDHRTDEMVERTLSLMPREEIYAATGIQFMQLNTLFQLMAERTNNPAKLDAARSLLMTPDLLNFWLTGNKVNEATIASTSQMVDPRTGDWAKGLLNRLDIPTDFLGAISPPGTRVGELHSSVRNETGAGSVPVIAPATHDTGSAVAAVPAEAHSGWAYISCGTWSLVGVEADRPYIDAKTLKYNLTNEGGINGTIRLLRNVMGLWLLQQCRACWKGAGHTYEYEDLARMGAEAPPFVSLVDPDHSDFLNPVDMNSAIASFCARTEQRQPDGVAATVRCIMDSLALKYRWVIERLEDVTGSKIETIHIIGGGCQNRHLCQATADATGRRVLAGPVEATAAGNILVQALATGALGTIEDARAMVRRSFDLMEYVPQNPDDWQEPYARMERLVEN